MPSDAANSSAACVAPGQVFEAVVIHDDNAALDEPWIEEIKAVTCRLVKVDIDMYQSELTICNFSKSFRDKTANTWTES